MVDCSVTETETLKQVFPSLDIYYCIFHVGQAWERKLRELHNVSTKMFDCPYCNHAYRFPRLNAYFFHFCICVFSHYL